MNSVYFACPHCRSYIDAGYRWAYWTLEKPGIVQEQEVVPVDRVLSATGYWSIDNSPESAWLREKVLPNVRVFLLEHRNHAVVYIDEDWIYAREESGETWSEIETWCNKAEGAAPNDGPAASLPNSAVTDGPPSVS